MMEFSERLENRLSAGFRIPSCRYFGKGREQIRQPDGTEPPTTGKTVIFFFGLKRRFMFQSEFHQGVAAFEI